MNTEMKGRVIMHEKMLWTNDNIQYMFHENILEYDMVAASLSISKRFQLLDDALIEQLKLMPKSERTKRVGLIQKDDKIYSEKLLQGIRDIRRKFLEINGLDETNVLSLHSDAIMFSSKKPIITDVEGVEFKCKGTWTSYVRFDKIEMFYANEYITYKGVNKQMLMEHTMGMNLHLKKIFEMLENYDESVFQYLSKFQSMYLQDKLPEYYYIPFGKIDKFKTYNLKLLAYMAQVVLSETRSW